MGRDVLGFANIQKQKMKINLEEFRNRKEYITERKHPTLDLLIWNYSQRCQFAKAWDEYTKMARGLITDLEGNIIARPFGKFFNLGETEESKLYPEKPIIYPKFDGSLGILYFDGDKPCIATRGSFESEQAIFATKWIQNKFPKAGPDFMRHMTYLFEIVYPQNRIVVNYGSMEELILLAVIDTETGEEVIGRHEWEGEMLNMKYAKRIEYEDLEKTIATISDDEEGYVMVWPQHNNIRVKVKGAEYVRLHRLLTQVSSKSVWELLANNQPLDEILNRVPDEFYKWVRDTQFKLEKEFAEIKTRCLNDFNAIVNAGRSRKDIALLFRQDCKYPQVLFMMLDGKDYEKVIWKIIKPAYERPFKQDEQ